MKILSYRRFALFCLLAAQWFERHFTAISQKLHDLDGTARETTSQQILTAVGDIDLSPLAKEATLTNMATSLDRLGDMVLATEQEQAEALDELDDNL